MAKIRLTKASTAIKLLFYILRMNLGIIKVKTQLAGGRYNFSIGPHSVPSKGIGKAFSS